MRIICCLVLVACFTGFSQELNLKGNRGGLFSLGIRSTSSYFTHEGGMLSTGYGGQFRLQFAERVNTEWYLDYMKGGNADYTRTDYHIGWSVMYYFLKPNNRIFEPYAIMGHCFDRTEMYENLDLSNSALKKSSAIQTGIGNHFRLTDRLDATLIAQYMFHLGGDIHADDHGGEVHFHRSTSSSLEGHFLFTVGFNYKIVDLWKGKS